MAKQEEIQRLVERAKAGDRNAFEAIFNCYKDRLQTAIQPLLDGYRRIHLDVDEVVQKTFVQALGSLTRFTWLGEDSLFPWLYGIARNAVLKLAEQSAKIRTLEIPERIPSTAVSPSKAARREERFDRLERCLSKLKPEYREVLNLARIEGLSIKEIAERMNRTESAVKHLIARAIRQLRESFGDTESLNLPPRSFEPEGNNHG